MTGYLELNLCHVVQGIAKNSYKCLNVIFSVLVLIAVLTVSFYHITQIHSSLVLT